MNNCLSPNVLLLILTTEEQESAEFQNSLLRNSRDDYNNGFQEILSFFASMNKTMTDMGKQIQNLEAMVNQKFKNLQTEAAGSMTVLTEKIINLEATANLNFENIESVKAQFSELGKLQRVALQTGKSFSESTLPEIISRVSSAGYMGRYTAVVFANYLDETINNFTIYDKNNATFNPAPNSIPAHTEEVFTFYEPECCRVVTSFSYVIPSKGVRIAAISQSGTWEAGLAFVSHGANMKTYYDSKKGMNGSSVLERGTDMDRNMSVGYQNLLARLFVRAQGEYKAFLRIELIKS